MFTNLQYFFNLLSKKEKPKFKQTNRIATEAEMRERKEKKLDKISKAELTKKKFDGLDIPPEKLRAIEKTVRRKLAEMPSNLENQEYSNLADPLVNKKYDVLGLGPGPDETEEPSAKNEEIKGNVEISESKEEIQKTENKIEDVVIGQTQENQNNISKKSITYDEWLLKKEAEESYWRRVVQAEKEEQKKLEEQKKQEEEEIKAQRYFLQYFLTVKKRKNLFRMESTKR